MRHCGGTVTLHASEAAKAEPVLGQVEVAIGRREEVRMIDEPSASTKYAARVPVAGPVGFFRSGECLIVLRIVPVGAPLPYIPNHVLDTVGG